MKRYFCISIIWIFILSLLGCTPTSSISPSSELSQPPGVVEPTYATNLRESVNCRLIVNGLDITDGNYVYINHQSRNTELPILAILRALGHETEVKYNEATGIYEGIVDQTNVLFTTAEEDLGIPLPYLRSGCIRYMDGEEFYLDGDSVESLLYWSYNMEIVVDYDNSIIYVESYDENVYVDQPAKLIVNGKDITHKTKTIIRSYHMEEYAILPLLAIAQELGIDIQQHESAVTLVYADKEEIIDLSLEDFGQMGAFGGTCVRLATDNEVFMDSFTAERLLKYLVGADINVDYDNAKVSVVSVP